MLARMVLRNACVMALLEKEQDGNYPTFAGKNIFDSRLYPAELDDIRKEVPVCAVYTETQTWASKPRDEQTLVNNVVQEVELCLEIAVAENSISYDKDGKPQKDVDGNDIVQATIIQTDDELEAILDLFEAQIFWTLSNPSKKWSVIFGTFCKAFTSYKSTRDADGGHNNRLATRKITLGCLICADPSPLVIPANIKHIKNVVCEGIPVTGTYLDDMLAGMAGLVSDGQGNLATAISIMRSTFGGGGGILWPALQRVGVKLTMDDPASNTGKITVGDAVIKVGD